ATAVTLVAYAAWLVRLRRRLDGESVGRLVGRVATSLFPLLVVNGALQGEPAVLAVGALLPVVVALPFVDRARLRWLVVASWLLAVFGYVSRGLLPTEPALPAAVAGTIEVAAMALVVGLALALLWHFAGRLEDAVAELGRLARLSSDLVATRDPRAAGDLIARHLVEATGADDGGICYLDPSGTLLLTYGFYPPERRAAVDDVYALADYPATRRVLEERRPLVVRRDDPLADPAEVAYLGSIGGAEMVILPLVARGTSLGTVELVGRRAGWLDRRRLELAELLASEASLGLENALLHEQLRRRAFEDELTGLANRALFRDRLEQALARRPRGGSGSPCCSSTSTTSRPSTTGSAMRPGTSSSPGSPSGCAAASGRPTRPPAWAATSSRSSSTGSARRMRTGSRSASSRRSACPSRSGERASGRPPASASSPARRARRPPTSSSAEPTSRCTGPRRPARTASSTTGRSGAGRRAGRWAPSRRHEAAPGAGRPAAPLARRRVEVSHCPERAEGPAERGDEGARG
ncbi:MAG TPA: GAF domain-containing protein, partial [Candidatus Limnocylindrales bacterium]|nr:GAF domain-containing protein [Candidatus Limnocylindrales bacterium]